MAKLILKNGVLIPRRRRKSVLQFTEQELYIKEVMDWTTVSVNKNDVNYKRIERPITPSELRQRIKTRHDDKFLYDKIKAIAQKIYDGYDKPAELIQEMLHWEQIAINSYTTKKLIMFNLAGAEVRTDKKSDAEIKRMRLLEAL